MSAACHLADAEVSSGSRSMASYDTPHPGGCGAPHEQRLIHAHCVAHCRLCVAPTETSGQTGAGLVAGAHLQCFDLVARSFDWLEKPRVDVRLVRRV